VNDSARPDGLRQFLWSTAPHKIDSALNTPFSDWGNILYNTTSLRHRRPTGRTRIFLLGATPSQRQQNPNPPPRIPSAASMRRAVMISRAESRPANPTTACPWGGNSGSPLCLLPIHVQLQRQSLVLLRGRRPRVCVRQQDDSTRRVYRCTTSPNSGSSRQPIYCVSGKSTVPTNSIS